MRLELTGRHVDITPILRRLVDAKLARAEGLIVFRDPDRRAPSVLYRQPNGELTLVETDE